MDKNTSPRSFATGLRLIFIALLLTGLDFGAVRPLSVRAASDIIYVKADATGANNGSSWADAFTDLQAALAAAQSDEEIWVAAGIYRPTTGSDRSATFRLRKGVALYAGFAGTETAREQRDREANVTILSGDIGTAGDTSDNSYHVVTGSGTDHTTVLDGFTITRGYANGDSALGHNLGGGMYNDHGDLTLVNCIFSGNSANYGGGMYNTWYSDPTLTNCAFSDNSALADGGGMYNEGSSPTLGNVTFSGNSADYGGGTYNAEDSDPTLINCRFSDNSADWGGGGMYNDRYSDPSLTDCRFSDNSAYYGGGGMYNSGSSPTLTDCRFNGNSALGNGGGMYNDDSRPRLANCTFSDNSADFGGAMFNLYSQPTLANCTVSGSSAAWGGGGMLNAESQPILANCTFSSNSAYYGGGMYSDVNSSPTLRNTIVANSAAGADCSGKGTITSEGSNLDSDGTCGFTGEGDLPSTDPLLGPLQDNGGPTFTHALLRGSAAIDGGDPGGCADPWGTPLTTDQRGSPRPVDGDCDGASICDIGAYEASITCYFPNAFYFPVMFKSAP